MAPRFTKASIANWIETNEQCSNLTPGKWVLICDDDAADIGGGVKWWAAQGNTKDLVAEYRATGRAVYATYEEDIDEYRVRDATNDEIAAMSRRPEPYGEVIFEKYTNGMWKMISSHRGGAEANNAMARLVAKGRCS